MEQTRVFDFNQQIKIQGSVSRKNNQSKAIILAHRINFWNSKNQNTDRNKGNIPTARISSQVQSSQVTANGKKHFLPLLLVSLLRSSCILSNSVQHVKNHENIQLSGLNKVLMFYLSQNQKRGWIYATTPFVRSCSTKPILFSTYLQFSSSSVSSVQFSHSVISDSL